GSTTATKDLGASDYLNFAPLNNISDDPKLSSIFRGLKFRVGGLGDDVKAQTVKELQSGEGKVVPSSDEQPIHIEFDQVYPKDSYEEAVTVFWVAQLIKEFGGKVQETLTRRNRGDQLAVTHVIGGSEGDRVMEARRQKFKERRMRSYEEEWDEEILWPEATRNSRLRSSGLGKSSVQEAPRDDFSDLIVDELQTDRTPEQTLLKRRPATTRQFEEKRRIGSAQNIYADICCSFAFTTYEVKRKNARHEQTLQTKTDFLWLAVFEEVAVRQLPEYKPHGGVLLSAARSCRLSSNSILNLEEPLDATLP
ncbi:hypothetical protein OSTOST_25537, partial [Ostertagia ostertagi]